MSLKKNMIFKAFSKRGNLLLEKISLNLLSNHTGTDCCLEACEGQSQINIC